MNPHPSRQTGYRGPITAVIFDWAGTMVDFGCMAPVEAFRSAFSQNGIAISETEARLPMGLGKREHIERILDMPQVQSRWRMKTGRAATAADVDHLYQAFLAADRVNVERFADPVPGARETVAALRKRGIAIGSTTGYPREIMDDLQPVAAARGYAPDHVCTVSDVERGRPAPDMVRASAAALRAPDPRACVVVDDSPTGLQSARAAGMWAVGISASGNEVGLPLSNWLALSQPQQTARLEPARRRLREAGAHEVIDTVADLLPVIDAIENRLVQGAVA